MSHYNRGPNATAHRGVAPSARYGGGDVVIRNSSSKCIKSQKNFKKLQKSMLHPIEATDSRSLIASFLKSDSFCIQ